MVPNLVDVVGLRIPVENLVQLDKDTRLTEVVPDKQNIRLLKDGRTKLIEFFGDMSPYWLGRGVQHPVSYLFLEKM